MALSLKTGYGSIITEAIIGEDTVVWHYCSLYKCRIGRNCKIASYVEIGNEVSIGDNCKIEAYVFIPHGVTLGDRVFVGPHVCFTNDKWPKAVGDWKENKTVVCNDVSIGANSTILSGIRIGKGAMIGAGSIITKDVPDGALVYGNGALERGTVH